MHLIGSLPDKADFYLQTYEMVRNRNSLCLPGADESSAPTINSAKQIKKIDFIVVVLTEMFGDRPDSTS